jgi:hypothetical protein
MAKRLQVKQYNGKTTKAGNPSYNKVNATRKQLLEILNSRENVPEEFKGIPASFEFANWTPNKDAEGYKEFIVRVEGVEVTDEITAFVRDILDPSWNEEVEKSLDIRTYRPPRKNVKMREAIVAKVAEMVGEGDAVVRGALATEVLELLEIQFS